jgi:FHA domain
MVNISTYQCPKGHISTEPDYCSDCGAKIQASPKVSTNVLEQVLSPVPTSKNTITCPACSAPHDPTSGNFCEICGYNFNTGAHGEVPPIPDKDVTGKDVTGTDVTGTDVTGTDVTGKDVTGKDVTGRDVTGTDVKFHVSTVNYLEITITVDAMLRSPESPEAPNQPPIILRLDKESNLIGRRSEARAINPEIALNFDSAVSHRHALINRQSDGTFTLRDIDSANGTVLNGVELTPMVDSVIQDGDELTLGHWTRILVKFK